jgi:uncharacterized membrane protein
MTQTIVAMYDVVGEAERAVRELRDYGIADRDISLLARDFETGETRDLKGSATATGVGVGAALGGLGGLLVGLGALTIPGLGPVLAAGPLGTGLAALVGAGAGAVAGGAAGGLLGALVDAGVPSDEVEFYAEGLRRGGTLVAVRASDDQQDRVRQILRQHSPVDMKTRAATWRQAGWMGYDPTAVMWTREQVESERLRYASEHPNRVVDADVDRYAPAFRGHYQSTFASSGYSYEHFEPAYRYGLTLGNYDPYRGLTWAQIEPEARRAWESRNPNTWERIKDAVFYGWERVRQPVRS